jgi:maltooligosyltrehalose trehalohydrolase
MAQIDLQEVGAHPALNIDGDLEVRFGLYLPGLMSANGYQVIVRLIHERDRFTPEIPTNNISLTCDDSHPYDLWQTTVNLSQLRDPASHFGESGTYLYRYQLFKNGKLLTLWFTDPFAYESGTGELAAFTTPILIRLFSGLTQAFRYLPWTIWWFMSYRLKSSTIRLRA